MACSISSSATAESLSHIAMTNAPVGPVIIVYPIIFSTHFTPNVLELTFRACSAAHTSAAVPEINISQMRKVWIPRMVLTTSNGGNGTGGRKTEAKETLR